jgi:predicted dehydrogenase
MSDMKVVVVGTGFGCLTHVPALRDAGFEVAALVGRDSDKTRARAERFDVPVATTSFADALAIDGVVAVSVVTPPHTHCDLVLEAIDAGKHVVCEKPFAGNLDEAKRMLAAADAAGIVHGLGCEFRYATAQEVLRRVVRGGEIGEPRTGLFVLEVPLIADHAAEVPDWWEDRGVGGGWLGAYGSHIVDQVRQTIGEFEGVSASLPVTSGRPMSADDTFTVHFRTTNGAEGVLHSSAGVRGMAGLTRISGTEGSVWLDGEAVHLATAAGERVVDVPADVVQGAPVPPPMDLMKTAYDFMHSMGIDRVPYAQLFTAFRRRIAGETPDDWAPFPTFADGVAGMAVLDAIRRADAERTWVNV